MFIGLSWLENYSKQDKEILDKSYHSSKKGNNCKPSFPRCESINVALHYDTPNPYDNYNYDYWIKGQSTIVTNFASYGFPDVFKGGNI